jgi:sugar-specific transcriptional regulator TrmB
MSILGLNTEPLREFGLSATEISVFLALQQLGSAKAGELIHATGIQNSVMHLTLPRLVKRGVLSYVRRGKVRFYQAVPPARLLELQANRTERLQSFVQELEERSPQRDLPEAEIYEGITGLRNMCFKLIEDAESGDEFLFLGFSSPNPEYEKQVYSFYREYTDIRLRRGLILKGVAHESSKKYFVENNWPHKNIRFVNFPIIQNISVCRDKAIIVPWLHAEVSFFIRSESFAKNLKEYFNSLWEEGRKCKVMK